jgi:hypothetical protein
MAELDVYHRASIRGPVRVDLGKLRKREVQGRERAEVQLFGRVGRMA